MEPAHVREEKRTTSPGTLKAGRIVFNQRRSVLDCTVRNLSSTGACLDVPSTGYPGSVSV